MLLAYEKYSAYFLFQVLVYERYVIFQQLIELLFFLNLFYQSFYDFDFPLQYSLGAQRYYVFRGWLEIDVEQNHKNRLHMHF